MKSIRLKLELKNRLDDYRSGLSVNKAIANLLNESDKPSEVILQSAQEYYNAKVDDDVFDELNQYRKYSNESHSDIINRLLDELDD